MEEINGFRLVNGTKNLEILISLLTSLSNIHSYCFILFFINIVCFMIFTVIIITSLFLIKSILFVIEFTSLVLLGL